MCNLFWFETAEMSCLQKRRRAAALQDAGAMAKASAFAKRLDVRAFLPLRTCAWGIHSQQRMLSYRRNMNLPTAQEIDPDNSLDGRAACQHFLGKNLDEAEALFREAPLYYQEDLVFMGSVAFRYYIQAAIRYIQSEAATGDNDIVGYLASILEFRLEHESAELVPIAKQLASACGYVRENSARFDDGFFGVDDDLNTRFLSLQQTFENLSGQAPPTTPP